MGQNRVINESKANIQNLANGLNWAYKLEEAIGLKQGQQANMGKLAQI